MITLTVDRMRTRYVGEAVRFDGYLRRMVDEELAPALAAVPLPAGHVCLQRLTVPVRLGPPGPAARSWAEQIAAALARAIGAGEGALVYPRTLDALVDLLVSLGRGDPSRAWAWRQLGLVAADPGRPDAAAVALVRRPDLACAALAAAAPHAPLPLTAAGWAAVARSVADLAGEPAAEGPAPAVAAVLAAPVTRRLPAAVAGLPAADLRAVARLLLLCAAPSLSRSGRAIAAVSGLLGRPLPPPVRSEPAWPGTEPAPPSGPSGAGRGGSDPAAQDPAAPHGRSRPRPLDGAVAKPRAVPDPAPGPGDPPGTGDGPAPAIPDTAADPEPGPILAAGSPAGAVSPAAGVLFLIPATGIPDLRPGSPPLAPQAGGAARPGPLADRPLSMVMGWLGARLGEVDTDDPAVHALAGQPREPLDPPGPAEETALAGLADEVRAWLRELLRLGPDDDLRWLWRRPARIAAEPGWVEVTYALEDVDTRVRAAGLDLDPGFVWWLGAVVRYRYA